MIAKIRTYNRIAPEGLAVFGSNYQVEPELADPSAILLRSHKLQPAQMAESLLAVGRAGAGTNNVPVEECTQRGIVVFNSPGANANAVAELAVGILLMVLRTVPAAARFVTDFAAATDEELEVGIEDNKKAFRGAEFYGSALGVVGLGAIGSRLAHCAVEMGAEVYGYDPAITVENAWRLPANVKRCNSLKELLSSVDAVSLHVPVLPATVDLLNAETLACMKPGSILLNYARGPIVQESAVLAALESGPLRMYACDFPTQALRHRQIESGDVFLTPHLGASTSQAEANSSVMAATQLMNFLETGCIKNSVNFPDVAMDWLTDKRIVIANDNIPSVLGGITAELAQRSINVVDMTNKSQGQVAWTLVDYKSDESEAFSQDLQTALSNVSGVLRVRMLERS